MASQPINTVSDLYEAVFEAYDQLNTQEYQDYDYRERDTALSTQGTTPLISFYGKPLALAGGAPPKPEQFQACFYQVYSSGTQTISSSGGNGLRMGPPIFPQKTLALRMRASTSARNEAIPVARRIADPRKIFNDLMPQIEKKIKTNEMWWGLWKSAQVTVDWNPERTAAIAWDPSINNYHILYNPAVLLEVAVENLIGGWPRSPLDLPQFKSMKPDELLAAWPAFSFVHECSHALYKHTAKRDGVDKYAAHVDIQIFGDCQININLLKDMFMRDFNAVPTNNLGNFEPFYGKSKNFQLSVKSVANAIGDFVNFDKPAYWDFSSLSIEPADVIMVAHTAALSYTGAPLQSILSVFKTAASYAGEGFEHPEQTRAREKAEGKSAPPPKREKEDPSTKYQPGQIVKYKKGPKSFWAVVQEILPPDSKGVRKVAIVPVKELTPAVQEQVKEQLKKAKNPTPTLSV